MPINPENNENTNYKEVTPIEFGSNSDNSEIDYLHLSVLNKSILSEDNNAQVLTNSKIYDSVPSRPIDKINVPEVKNIKVDFVYNYYTADERVRNGNSNGSKILNVDFSDSDEINFQIKNKKSPRFIRVSFLPPQADQDSIETEDINDLISNNISSIICEGSLSNEIYTGVEILDTGKERKIYSMLNGSMMFSQINSNSTSQKEASQKLYETLKEKGGLEGEDKRLIVESFSNISSKGYTLSPADVSEDIAKRSNDPLGKQTFSIQFNNLLMSNIVNNSTIYSDNIFNDEMRSLTDFAEEIRSELLPRNIFSQNPPVFDPMDYELSIEAIDMKPVVNTLGEEIKKYPTVKFLGYLIEKFEVLPDESVEFSGRIFSPGHTRNEFVDYEVRYGGNYFYKIRTLCRVQALMSSVADDPILDQLVVGDIIIASEGRLQSVTCIEKVPPPPPEGLKFSFDFKTLLPRISWRLPFNKQRDIKRFQIFKRFSVEEPFIAIAEIDFDNSAIRGEVAEIIIPSNYYRVKNRKLYFIDKTHKEGEKPIYAIACVDAHGMSSNYSAQVQIERDKYSNRVNRKIISGPNAPKPFPNIYLNEDAFKDVIKTSRLDRMMVFFDPEYYKVFGTRPGTENTNLSEENLKDLNLLAIDDQNSRYKIHIINVDNQKDKTVSIKLSNNASPSASDQDYYEMSSEKFNPNSLSFQY